MAIDFMHMSMRHLGEEACIPPLSVLEMLYVITTIDPTIEVMIPGGRTCSPMETEGLIMLRVREIVGDMSSIDLHGT